MKGRSLFTLAAVACLATAPVVAQQPAAASATRAPVPAQRAAGPRLEPEYRSYQPAVARNEASLSTTAAADRTVITISTLGLVLLAVLLIVLLT